MLMTMLMYDEAFQDKADWRSMFPSVFIQIMLLGVQQIVVGFYDPLMQRYIHQQTSEQT